MITVTPLAAEKIKTIHAAQSAPAEAGLRVRVLGNGCSGMQYELIFDTPASGDQVFEAEGIRLLVDPKSILRLVGTEIDFVDGVTGTGFALKNPNDKGRCSCGSGGSCSV